MGQTTQHKGKLYTPLNHMIDVASYWACACQKTADLWHLRRSFCELLKLHLNAFITLPYALWNLTLTIKEITCKWQNHSFLSKHCTSQALYQTLQTTTYNFNPF